MTHWNELRRSWTPWLRLNCEPPVDHIWREFEAVQHRLVNHREDYGRGWKSLTLHGLKPEWTEAAEQYAGYEKFNDQTAPYDWTEIAALCPETVRFIKSLPYTKFFRVRFMYLEPGGEIQLHRDTDQPNLSPLNIAIRHPEPCHFDMYHGETKSYLGRVPFSEGRAFFVNIGTYHQVQNLSDQGRLHMIIHGRQSEDFNRNPQAFMVSP